jgi:membrane-bound inhibitor of C-type lysozyme
VPQFSAASAAVVLLLAVGATACKKAEAPAESSPDAAATPAAAATAAAPAPAATETVSADTKYQCSSGVVPVSYKSGAVTVTLKDKVLELKADPANADRYVGTGVEWWTNGRGQGATANLYAQTPEGTAGDVLEGCVENPQA